MKTTALGLTLALVTAATTAQAGDWRAPRTHVSHPDAAAAARAELSAAPELAGLSLRQERVLTTAAGPVVRLAQRHHGLPVLGGQVAVAVRDGRVRQTVSTAAPLWVDPEPTVAADAARDAAIAHLVAEFGQAAVPRQPTLAVRPSPHGGDLLWVVDVPDILGGQRVLVDAHSGALAGARSLAVHVDGRVYPISSVVTPDLMDLELTSLTIATPQKLNGWDGNLQVTNYASGGQQSGYQLVQELEPNVGEDFLYDPPQDPFDGTDAFAQVMVYYHLTRMREFYQTLGVDMSAESWGLVAVANIQEEGNLYDNAFFSQAGIDGPFAAPNMIGIGQGQIDFALDSDVFNHELTHYVSHNAVNYNASQIHGDEYGLSPWSGSIDEGISDYFACTLNDDPILGEATLGAFGVGRDLSDTSKTCPDDIRGEVHDDGELIGSYLWTIRGLLGAPRADQLAWATVAMLPYGADFEDFANALTLAADGMLEVGTIDAIEREAISAALAERGLDSCSREQPLLPGEPHSFPLLFGLELVGQLFGASCAEVKAAGVALPWLFHQVVTPAPGDAGVAFNVTMVKDGPGDLSWAVYVRKDAHVTFTNNNGFFPEVDDYDYAVENVTGASGSVYIGPSSNPPFDPNATYHAVVVHQNCPSADVTIATSNEEPPSTSGVGGGSASAASSSSSGQGGNQGTQVVEPVVVDTCGCRVVGEPRRVAAGWLSLCGLAALLVARRRKW